jgi:hypothetical protein
MNESREEQNRGTEEKQIHSRPWHTEIENESESSSSLASATEPATGWATRKNQRQTKWAFGPVGVTGNEPSSTQAKPERESDAAAELTHETENYFSPSVWKRNPARAGQKSPAEMKLARRAMAHGSRLPGRRSLEPENGIWLNTTEGRNPHEGQTKTETWRHHDEQAFRSGSGNRAVRPGLCMLTQWFL